jgi:hypothetical protein
MNPLNGVPADRATTVLLLALAATGIAAAMILVNDTRLRDRGFRSSAELEWLFDREAVARRVGAYDDKGVTGDVLRGLALDTFFFIPAYVLLLAVGCFRVAPDARLPLFFGWAAVAAGVLDLIENSGILLEITRQVYSVAPLTGTVCRVKWLIGGACALFAIFGPLLFCHDRV